MVRLPDSWRFSLSASSLPENPLPTPSAGVRMIAETSVSHHPLRHPWQALQERDGLREFMSLPGSQDERHRPSKPIGDHASFGSIAPTRAAQRLTLVPLSLRPPFRAAPAAF